MTDHDEAPESDGPAEPWSAFVPGQEMVPAYLTSRFAAQYRVIVEVLLAEQDTSLNGLPYDALAAGIRAHLVGRFGGRYRACARHRRCLADLGYRGRRILRSAFVARNGFR